jgi:chromate transporter
MKSPMLQPQNDTTAGPGAAPSFAAAFRFWLKLGFISFGGPAGQIAILHQELVDRRRWISEGRFLHALNYCMLLPGPEAQQLATYLGWLMHRTFGGLIAGVLFVLPGFVCLIVLSWLYVRFGHVVWIAGLFRGIKPAVTAIVVQAVVRIGSRTLKNPTLWAIAAAAFLGIFVWNLPFPLIVAAAALCGAIGARVLPRHFTLGGGQGRKGRVAPPALLDDDTPIPSHARFSASRLAVIAITGFALWAAPLGLLAAAFGWQHGFTQMGWFFTKAALLTFGGAYAVLPYVYQGAVTHYGWLQPAQMIDGLALGETTPGPLIMVVSFVGFVGGYQLAPFGADASLAAGLLGATLVTWFTFLPSFLFVLAGGPLVESTRGVLQVSAPLNGITAAIVGVMLNLALFFAYHVLWPQGFGGKFDAVSLAIGVAAAIALLRFKRSVPQVIGLCALAGLALALLD